MNLSIVHTTIWKEIMKRVKKKLVSLLMTGMLLAGAYRVYGSGRIAGGSE